MFLNFFWDDSRKRLKQVRGQLFS